MGINKDRHARIIIMRPETILHSEAGYIFADCSRPTRFFLQFGGGPYILRQLPQAILSLEYGAAIEPDTIILPESVVEDLTTPVGRIFKPLFDLVWNACGLPASLNFDSERNWVNRR